MSIYVVGDLQGCLTPLTALLDFVHFDKAQDTLWCVGDLVNRGPESLDALRFVHQLGAAGLSVLGNHDLHLLAVAEGFAECKSSDTLADILAAPDRDELLHWLRHLPLLHHQYGYTLCHAGIAPQWSLSEAQRYAKEVEAALQGDHYRDFLANMYGNKPKRFKESLQGYERLRSITNYFTRMRFCYTDGKLDFKNKSAADSAAPDTLPWFAVPNRKMANEKIIFGHWAALLGQANTANIYALDTGCVWGNALSLMRLEDEALFRFDCASKTISTGSAKAS